MLVAPWILRRLSNSRTSLTTTTKSSISRVWTRQQSVRKEVTSTWTTKSWRTYKNQSYPSRRAHNHKMRTQLIISICSSLSRNSNLIERCSPPEIRRLDGLIKTPNLIGYRVRASLSIKAKTKRKERERLLLYLKAVSAGIHRRMQTISIVYRHSVQIYSEKVNQERRQRRSQKSWKGRRKSKDYRFQTKGLLQLEIQIHLRVKNRSMRRLHRRRSKPKLTSQMAWWVFRSLKLLTSSNSKTHSLTEGVSCFKTQQLESNK
jgi:hypothetical protein